MDDGVRLGVGFAVGALAIGSILAVGWGIRRWMKPQIEFLDIVYDKRARHLELYVVNESEKPVFVSPSLKLVHFLNPEEWRDKNGNANANGAMLEGKCYQMESVIKGYSMIGQCEGEIKVDSRSVRKIIYPLSDDINLRLYDNIRVDSTYGFKNASGERMTGVMRVVVKEDSEPITVNKIPEENVQPAYLPNFCVVSDSDVAEPYANPTQSGFPVQAMCVCCGKDRWLEWVVDGNHVCGECKDYLAGPGLPMLPENQAELFVRDFVSKLEDSAVASIDASRDASRDVSVNDRQAELLNLLENENNLTVKKISKHLSIKESTVASDLAYLMHKGIVDRVKIKNRFIYHLV